MAKFDDLTITNNGLDMIALSQSGAKLIFTKIKLGDGQIGDNDVMKLTDIINERMTSQISSIEAKGEGQVAIKFTVDNSELTSGFFVREIGIFAKINEGGEEKLYAYTNAGNYTNYLADNKTPIDAIITKIDLAIGNATDINFTVDKSIIYVSLEDLETNLQKHNSNIDSHTEAFTKHNDDENAHDNLIKRLFGSAEATLDSIKLKIKEWAKEVCLPLSGGTMNGNINASGYNITATKFIGNLQGKANSAANADLATKANQDSQGQTINTTYVKGITASNATLTLTKGNGTTSTVTINNVGNSTKATQDSQGQAINTTYVKGVTASNSTITVTKGNGTTSTATINNVANATNAANLVISGTSASIKYGGGDVDESTAISQNKVNLVIGSWYSTGFRDLCSSGTPIRVAINHRNGNIKTSGAVTAVGAMYSATPATTENSTRVATTAYVKNNVVEIIKKVYPVGSIYMSTVSTNPATLFGFGTWEAMPAGRVLLAQGKSSWGTTYNAGSTGGEATHQLTVGELPAHNHSASTNTTGSHAHTYTWRNYQGWAGSKSATSVWENTATNNTGSAGEHSHTVTINNTGSNQAHNNLQPYIAVYIWKRTA